MNWLIAANSKVYDHASSFEHFSSIDWHMGRYKYNVNDIVYVYSTRPFMKIMYKCIIKKVGMQIKDIRDDYEYWIDKDHYKKMSQDTFMHLKLLEQVDTKKLELKALLDKGLKAAPQGPVKLTDDLVEYIDGCFGLIETEYYPEMLNSEDVIFEGLKKTIVVNKYERSSVARNKCIEYHGVNCKICNLNFEEAYGEIGKGFIHVHHKKPVHEIGKEYKIDYKNDLIPVCPNCHAMLHRKVDSKDIGIEELKLVRNI